MNTRITEILEKWRWAYRAWRYRLKVEPVEVRCLLEHLRPGDTAIDIGAHKGAFTYWMLKRVRSRGAVYAFEPQPRLAEQLKRLTGTSGRDNVVVENLAVSSRSGQLMIHVPNGGCSPSASLEPQQHNPNTDEAYPVTVTSLDEYFADQPKSPVRLIKCDVEGHELEVFRGGEKLLSRYQPHLLFECEVRHRASGNVDEVFSYLADLGYEGSCLTRTGAVGIEQFDAGTYQADSHSVNYVNNFLFCPTSRRRQVRAA